MRPGSVLGYPVRSRNKPSTRSGTLSSELDETQRALFATRSDFRATLRAAGPGQLHDPLTGLPTRVLLSDFILRAIERQRRHPQLMFACLVIELDRFKTINGSLGHAYGDELLVMTAERLEGCLRAGDVLGRLAGDEFVIVLDGIRDMSDATRVAQRIHEVLAPSFVLAGREVFVTASIGIAGSSTGYSLADDVLRDANIAMYRAQGLGKARHVIFDSEMHERAVAMLELETDVRRGFDRSEFRVHYQPIVSLATGTIKGFEALLRWQHPDRGVLSPSRFLHAAEDTGIIVPLGWWALEEACRQLRAWQGKLGDSALGMSVNLSSKQFAQEGLVDRVVNILKTSGLRPQCLNLEITESTILEDTASARKISSELRELGVRIHMDDFGTGYASLTHLHRIPVDTLKIDRSFVSAMEEDEDSIKIVETIVLLAHRLGKNVVAEGVESIKQMRRLGLLKCEFGQGYFFSRPLTAEHAEALLSAGQPRNRVRKASERFLPDRATNAE